MKKIFTVLYLILLLNAAAAPAIKIINNPAYSISESKLSNTQSSFTVSLKDVKDIFEMDFSYQFASLAKDRKFNFFVATKEKEKILITFYKDKPKNIQGLLNVDEVISSMKTIESKLLGKWKTELRKGEFFGETQIERTFSENGKCELRVLDPLGKTMFFVEGKYFLNKGVLICIESSKQMPNIMSYQSKYDLNKDTLVTKRYLMRRKGENIIDTYTFKRIVQIN